MKIKIWGCRGSITTPGAQTVRFGGNTTCLEIRDARGNLLIVDAGSGLRNLGKAILQEPEVTRVFFLFTHSHWDHIVGFPFFGPAYSERYDITLCGGPRSQISVQQYVAQQMAAPFFPVPFEHLKARFSFSCHFFPECAVGGLTVSPIKLNHPNGGFGYKFMEGGKSFVFLTDNELGCQHQEGLPREQYVEFCREADLLMHDAQYTEVEYRTTRGWGHSTGLDAADLAVEAHVKRLVLFHHDPDRSDDEVEEMVRVCRQRIEYGGGSADCLAAEEGMEINL